MNARLLTAAGLLMAGPLFAEGVSGRAEVSYQSYDYGSILTEGMRQQYDLRLEHALTMTSLVRLFVRDDDFHGTSTTDLRRQGSGFRQLQPGGEFSMNTDALQLLARADYFDIRDETNGVDASRTLDRRAARLSWTPLALPRFDFLGQRNRAHDAANQTDLTDEFASGIASYQWRSLDVRGEARYTHSYDPVAGYDQSTLMRGGDVAYAASLLGGKLTVGGQGTAQLTRLKQSATSGSEVPVPIAIAHAQTGIDDTPADDRDHPLTAAPLLTDNNLDTSAGISLGPDGASFQNFAVDIGRVDRIDEIRVVVRDGSGNPLRNGGGPVTWDAYTSQDGVIWTPLSASSTFNTSLSFYSIRFAPDVGRWFKVVSFGVNSEPTWVTEVQAYYHAQVSPGASRDGNQNAYTALANVSYQPVKRLTLTYSGNYNSLRQNFAGESATSTVDAEHLAAFDVKLVRGWSVRGQYLRRNITSFAGAGDRATILTGFLDYDPTQQLRMSVEIGHQTETLDGTPFDLDTRALHATAYVLRSLLVTSNVGIQTQTISTDGSVARRQYADLAANAQLFPTIRMIVTAALQRTRTQSTDPAIAILGPVRDERVTADFVWRPGRQLTLQTVVGWASGLTLHGFTERYHAEWFPFGDGTVSLGGSWDQDIDPSTNRKASRAMFTPRWAMNRFVAFDLNFTKVRTTSDTASSQQKLLFATVTVTR